MGWGICGKIRRLLSLLAIALAIASAAWSQTPTSLESVRGLALPNFPYDIGWAFAATVLDGQVHVFGGDDGSCNSRTNHSVYDPATHSWDTNRAAMLYARVLFRAVPLNGQIYVFGGNISCRDWLREGERYDPVADTCTPISLLPKALTYYAAAAADGRIYAMGGSDGSSGNNHSTYAYDPVANEWSPRAPFPGVIGYASATPWMSAVEFDSRVYTIVCDFVSHYWLYSYSPTNDTWASHGMMPLPYVPTWEGPQMVRVQDRLVVIANIGPTTLYSYTPANGQWQQIEAHEAGLTGEYPQFAGDGTGVYVLAGRNSSQAQYFEFKPLTNVSPSMALQPADQVIWANAAVGLGIGVVGSGPMYYQWSRDSTAVLGATNSVLTFAHVQASDGGAYSAVASNAFGAVTSITARVSIVNVADWGDNTYGETSVPPGLSNVVAIGKGQRGESHNLAVRADGTVVAWGWNGLGQTNVPPGLSNVVAVAGGGGHSLALRSDGKVIAWGRNDAGQADVPPGLSNVVAIAAGDTHSLALRADGTVAGWGKDDVNWQPISLPFGLNNVVAIAAGSAHDVAVRADGTVVAWGANNRGQTSVPPGLSSVLAIASGEGHSLALRRDGTVVAWGENYYGQINLPSGLSNVVAVAAGAQHSLALKSDGTIVAWGLSTYRQTDVPVGLTNVVAVAGGGWDSAAVLGVGAPFITTLLADRTVGARQTVDFYVSATGAWPLRYQWLFNGTNVIAGATNATLTLTNVQLSSAGSYSVIVSNGAGIAAGRSAALMVEPFGKPSVVIQGWVTRGGAVFFTNTPSVTVELLTTFPGGTLLYTLDGSDPATGTFYTGPLTLTDSAVVRAIAYDAEFSEYQEANTVTVTLVRTWTLMAATPGGGTITLDPPGGTYLDGTSVTVTAVPDPGWTFLDWTGNATGTNASIQLVLNTNKSVQAVFGTTLSISVTGSGTMFYSPVQSLYPYGATVTFWATPNAGNWFRYWTNAAAGNSVSPLTLAVTTSTPLVTASFAPLLGNQVALAVLTNGSGTVTVSPLANVYTNGQTLTLTATPAPGWFFESWSGETNSLANPLTLTLTGVRTNKTIIAQFKSPARIIAQPRNCVVSPGANVTFTVAAEGTAPMSYQWKFYGADLPGATNASLSFTNVQSINAGVYSVGVSNSFGGETSVAAALIVDRASLALIKRQFDVTWCYNLALKPDGTLVDWGCNPNGAVHLDIPPDLTNAVAVSAGAWHAMALRADSTVIVWGVNACQPDATSNRFDLANVAAVVASVGSFALLANGTVFGWGCSSWGILDIPVGLSNVVAITGGGGHILALKADGTVVAWGLGTQNNGQNWDFGQAIVPPGLSNVIAVAGGATHSLALRQDGTVVAWGWNEDGQTNVPPGLSDVVAIAAGRQHSLALKSDGTVVAWGWSALTQVPTNLVNAVAIAAGDSHSLALRADGTLVAWGGANPTGQLNIPPGLMLFPVITAGPVAPSIITAPQSQGVSLGSNVTFTVTAGGTLPLRYQWFFNATNLLADATSSTFTLTNVQLAQAGSYSVVVTNVYGAVTSAPAILTVLPANAPPEVYLTSPTNGAVFTAPATILVSALAYDSDGVARVEFCTDGVLVAARTNTPWSFTWSNVPAGSYTLTARATDTGGLTATSSPVGITVTTQFTNTPVFSLSSAVHTVSETNGTLAVTILKTPNSPAAGVNYQTIDGSAVGSSSGSGGRFQHRSGYLAFNAGETVATITIPIVNDSAYEGPGNFTFTLFGPDHGGILGTPSSAVITISDEEDFANGSLLDTRAPQQAPPHDGSIVVNTEPPEVHGQWRLAGELSWRNAGTEARNLAYGNWSIEFKPVAGHLQPAPASAPVGLGYPYLITAFYAPFASPQLGSLAVFIKPDSVATNGDPTYRGMWHLEGDTNWYGSGQVLSNLSAGEYVVEFKPAQGLVMPSNLRATVAPDQLSSVAATYMAAGSLSATTPGVVQFQTVQQAYQLPYRFNGQIRTELAYGSGAVIKEKLVLTAAHVVFNDATFNYVTNVQWLFQRDGGPNGSYEPLPQTPRGFYLLDGYAAQRRADNTPGASSPAAQNLDVAVMYFLEPAGRGGYGGYLVSDATNVWLQSSTLKMLIGYPMDPVIGDNRKRMHATAPGIVNFAPVLGQVFATTEIMSYGGNSGGPLCVQTTNGNYYPAGVYLGGTAQTVVRAIDATVVELIRRAEVSSNGGTNATGGGVVPLDAGAMLPGVQIGYLRVSIAPACAVNAGAKWQVVNYTNLFAPDDLVATIATTYPIAFTPVSGYSTPAQHNVVVASGQTNTIFAYYTPQGFLSLTLSNGLTLSGPSGATYRVEYAPNLNGGAAWSNLTTLRLSNGPQSVPNTRPTNTMNRFYRAVFVE